MLASNARPQIQKVLDPLSQWAARSSVSPDLVTVIGTIGVAGGALGFFTLGHFFVGTLVITLFVFSDLVDGVIARARGISSKWGAFLDSTSDRVGDGAIFGSLVIWYAGDGDSLPLAGAALLCLVAGSVTSYVKARAESLGFTCNVGFAERGERLLILLVAAGLYGLGVPYLLPVALWFLVGATVLTVAQRVVHVYRQFVRSGRPTLVPPAGESNAAGEATEADQTGAGPSVASSVVSQTGAPDLAGGAGGAGVAGSGGGPRGVPPVPQVAPGR
ncbi:CDP-diacylglycerol--glycerol-3-phosphate 3-phosphatidyltransferase [Parafrankia irregularis]|uniref:Phosphatidylinositol phosphate synthase n=1 Tax=Parafrankia irregularis TaxID=795642 RepID=A0A0S4QKG4_9ACTN|nr:MULTISPECIES: CDP-alcohol phosphatidyltransferase family protein [Parafrankia]MBE3202016.1 CDP-alcohol phosphatidyltransferase family protein [Parafrankia sp. CH37]CUU55790.1 CDP-diacylglycerol--glycerol-3-phosphate 3-phosphatidyltransferase [Parafrankia irregularis]